RESAEVEPLTASDDRRGHLVWLRGREDEPNTGRRLLEELQQRVERFAGQPLRLVDDVDLLATDHRGGRGLLAELPSVVDPTVGCGIDLDHIHVGPLADGHALLADVARLHGWRVHAVDHLGEDPRGGGLAGSARSAEQERVMEPILADRSGQPPDHVVLAQQLGRCLRPIPAVQGLVLLLYPFVLWPFVLWPFVLWHAVHAPLLTEEDRPCTRHRRRETRARSRTAGSGQASPRHPPGSAKGCCVPALTRFAVRRRVGPDLQRPAPSAASDLAGLRRGFSPASSGSRVTGHRW